MYMTINYVFRSCQVQCGVANLARALNQILVDHIRTMLPSLRSKIEDAVGSRQKELRMYGDAPPGNTNAARYASFHAFRPIREQPGHVQSGRALRIAALR